MIRALRRTVLVIGYAFLYGPILLVVVYSFNASRLVTVWTGWSIRWYGALWADRAMVEAVRVSLAVAFAAASLACVLGTITAMLLVRGRTGLLTRTLVFAPLVLPDVVTGVSLLLVFVALDMDRGFLTLVVAHAGLGLPYVALMVGARARALDPALEEAAQDLGATPIAAFLTVTLPLLVPAIAAGFLLAASLSLDDVVIASFVSGPGWTTLPMRLYSQLRLGLSPEVNAVSTLLLAAVALAFSLCVGLGMRPVVDTKKPGARERLVR